MNSKETLSAFLFSLYIHGLTFYFCVSGLLGVHTSILTAAYQVVLTFLPLLLTLTTKESRKNFLKFDLLEVLYIVFIVIFSIDAVSSPIQADFPENLTIYFAIYWLAMAIARSLTLEQLKVICRVTSGVAAITSLILVAQVLTGTATWVDNGGRLAAGTSGNPILTGYTGAYAFLTNLILWAKSKSVEKIVWLGMSIPGLLVCVYSGTRSATLSVILGGLLLVIYNLSIIFKSGKVASKFLSGFVISCALILSISVVSPFFGAPGELNTATASPIDTGLKRIEALTQFGGENKVQDLSLRGRQELYQNAWESFANNPVWGGGLYSVGGAHNAFLQVVAEFGILGIVTFILPFLYLGYQLFAVIAQNINRMSSLGFVATNQYLRSDYSMITSFVIVIFVQTIQSFSFHGDPYRSYLPICSIGIVIAFLRLGKSRIKKATE